MLLGVAVDATADDVQAAFRARVRQLHPDLGGAGGDLAAFVAAKAILLRLARTPSPAAATGPAPAAGAAGAQHRPRGFVTWTSADLRSGRVFDRVA